MTNKQAKTDDLKKKQREAHYKVVRAHNQKAAEKKAHQSVHHKTKFQIITMCAIWAMIIFTVGAMLLGALAPFAQRIQF